MSSQLTGLALAHIVKNHINPINTSSSGAMLEMALMLMSDDEFFALRDFFEDEDPNCKATINFIGDIVGHIATKMNMTYSMPPITIDQFVTASKNLYFMVTAESLRRRGLLELGGIQDIFVNDDTTCTLTDQGVLENVSGNLHSLRT